MKYSIAAALLALSVSAPSSSAFTDEIRTLAQRAQSKSVIAATSLSSRRTIFAAASYGSSRRVQEDQCTFCANGGTPTLMDTGVVNMFGSEEPLSCRDIEAMLSQETEAENVPADSPECLLGQAATYASCGCPEAPELPEGMCTVCPDGSPIPADKLADEVQGHGLDMDEDGTPDSITCADAQMLAITLSVMEDLGEDCAPQCWANLPDEEAFCEGSNDGAGLDQTECEANQESCEWETCEEEFGRRLRGGHTLSHRTSRRMQGDEGNEADMDICPIIQALLGPQCGCPAAPKSCPICLHGLVDSDIDKPITSPLDGTDSTCGILLATAESFPAGDFCDQVQAAATPETMALMGCQCAVESDLDTQVPDSDPVVTNAPTGKPTGQPTAAPAPGDADSPTMAQTAPSSASKSAFGAVAASLVTVGMVLLL